MGPKEGGTGGSIAGRVDAEEMGTFLTSVYLKVGLKRAHAQEVVSQLIDASLRGVDTHGVILAERYVKAIKRGEIKTAPRIKVLRDNISSELLDGDRGAGQFVAMKATRDAISKATKTGMGAVSVINISHCGMLAHYGIKIAEKKMAGLIFTNSLASAAPMGGSERVFGTNPFCFAFPFEDYPIVFDGATSAAAGMKLQLARMEGKEIPAGWALDAEGRPTTDPVKAIDGVLLPFGGHKGYALMLMVEIYAAVLGGGQFSKGLDPSEAQGGLYIQALDIRRLRSYREYSDDLETLVRSIKAAKLAEGSIGIFLPGEMERAASERRAREGIPVHRETWSSFERISDSCGVDLPKLV